MQFDIHHVSPVLNLLSALIRSPIQYETNFLRNRISFPYHNEKPADIFRINRRVLPGDGRSDIIEIQSTYNVQSGTVHSPLIKTLQIRDF